MSNMLRKSAPYSCCLRCDRRWKTKPGFHAFERRLARKREKRAWLVEATR